LGLSDAARLTIDCIRKSEPSRRVGGGRHNVTGRYPSRKMGVTIQFESHRVELPAIYELEHDADVIEYFDQAPSIKLDYCAADGKRLGVFTHRISSSSGRTARVGKNARRKKSFAGLRNITRIDIAGEKIAGYARQEKRTLRTLGFTIGFDLPVRFSGCFSGTSSFLKTI